MSSPPLTHHLFGWGLSALCLRGGVRLALTETRPTRKATHCRSDRVEYTPAVHELSAGPGATLPSATTHFSVTH